MKISRLVLAASFVASLAACDTSALEDGGGGAGGYDATGGATGGQPPTESDPRYGQDERFGESTGSDGAGGAPAPGNTSSSTGSGTSTGTGSDACDTCCDGEPVYGDESIYMRVDDSSSFASPLLTRAILESAHSMTRLSAFTGVVMTIWQVRCGLPLVPRNTLSSIWLFF